MRSILKSGIVILSLSVSTSQRNWRTKGM